MFMEKFLEIKKTGLIKKIINENRLTSRIKQDSNSCPCYHGTRCHNHLSDYNMICLLCVCPEYKKDNLEGGCNLDESKNFKDSKGKWFYNQNLPMGKIWDCTECYLPHTGKFVKNYLNQFSMEQLEELKKCKNIIDLWNFFESVSWK
jgi:Zn-finger protein